MRKTLVLQSHRTPLPATWISRCIHSVQNWAEIHRFDYRFIGDELYDYVPATLLDKTKTQPIIATDLARLRALQFYLTEGFETVIWCDADFLIFSPRQFILPNEKYAIGREVWIQASTTNTHKLTAYVKVHNAFMMYAKGNSFLGFYADTAERLLTLNQGRMSPQFIGPKLLTAIHNIGQCPVMENAAMFSPLVIRDIANQGGPALDLLHRHSIHPPYAANLCSSLFEQGELTEQQINHCIDVLVDKRTA